MTFRPVFLIVLILLSLLSSCQSKSDEKLSKEEIINNHIKNVILRDIILIYKDKYGELPETLTDVIRMYEKGANEFGLDKESIKLYIQDPYSKSRNNLIYKKLSNKKFIIYSVGPDGANDNKINTRPLQHNNEFQKYDPNSNKGDFLIYLYEE